MSKYLKRFSLVGFFFLFERLFLRYNCCHTYIFRTESLYKGFKRKLMTDSEDVCLRNAQEQSRNLRCDKG